MWRLVPLFLLAAMIATAFGAGPTTSATKPAAAPPTWDSYRLILNRNIFSRDRTSSLRVRDPRASYTRNPGSELVLTGVFLQGAEHVAFFEDSRSNETTRLSVGQSFGGGTVTAISLAGVEINLGDRTQKIAIGESLSGRAVELASPAPPPSAASAPAIEPSSAQPQPEGAAPPAAAPVAAPAAAPAPEGGSIEERMRLRRLQENR